MGKILWTKFKNCWKQLKSSKEIGRQIMFMDGETISYRNFLPQLFYSPPTSLQIKHNSNKK